MHQNQKWKPNEIVLSYMNKVNNLWNVILQLKKLLNAFYNKNIDCVLEIFYCDFCDAVILGYVRSASPTY